MQRKLSNERPDLLAEWHPEKNGDLRPDEVSPQSNKKVWWLGKCGHEWQAKICNRYNGAGCPYCSGRYTIKGINDLATTDPDIAREWHPTKNGKLAPVDVKAQSNKKAWWICANGHEWEAVIGSRRKNGCPYCSGKKVLTGYNDLATTHPELIPEWHPTKNGDKTPESISAGHDKKVWWICQFGHEWEAPVYNRVKGNGCPICAKGQRSSFAEQAVYYYIKKAYPDAKNGDQSYGDELDIYIPSIRTAIEYDGYKWHSSKQRVEKDQEKNDLCKREGIVLYRFREEGCPPMEEAAHLRIIASRYGDEEYQEDAVRQLASILGINVDVNFERDRIKILEQYASARRNKSLAEVDPELASEWHPKKNGKLTPLSVNAGSEYKVWWLGECRHEWKASIANRVKGKGCPYCSGKKVLPGFNDLATTDPMIAKQWHPTKNGNLKPEDVTKNSNKKVWWKCSKDHEWEAVINSRKINGCPYCSGQKVLPGFNDLATVSPEVAKEWDYRKNGDLKPAMFTGGSNQKVWWICDKGHEWQSKIRTRTKGRGCPKCGRESASQKLGRKIICIETGVVFDSIKSAARFCDGHDANITKCCKGQIKSAYGYHWNYYDQK